MITMCFPHDDANRETSMSQPSYRTSPDPNETRMPSGVPYIVGNEAAERFSFYGMRAILYVFMTEHLIGLDGELATMEPTEANIWLHNFQKATYAFPIFGAVICDWFLGKYRTILYVSLLYCVGHAIMAMCDIPGVTGLEPRTALYWGLALIAIGAGGIKPCVSSHVGDQFGPSNKGLITTVYGWFYLSINVGAAVSSLLTPLLLDTYGPGVAFGLPGVLMGLATLLFWLGRNDFVHVPPGGSSFLRDTFSRDGLLALANLIPLFLLLTVFWSLFDQTSTTWVEQSKHLDRTVLGITFSPSQIQAVNPVLILILVPIFTQLIYPWAEKRIKVTPLRKIGVGFVIAPLSYMLIAWLQQRIDAGETPSVAWQLLAYLVITTSEVLISITALEFSYTQAPLKMKSFVTGVYWGSVYLGNEIVVKVNEYIQSQQESGAEVLEGAAYFRLFTWAMIVTTVIYIVWSQFYRGRTYIQGEEAEPAE